MRNIQVSADVFQAIWAARQPGEDDEDAILRRVMRVQVAKPNGVTSGKGKPWVDSRFGTVFPHGFELFRTYLGREYQAVVDNGKWVLNGQAVKGNTINALSTKIGATTENGWMNWNYRDAKGAVQKVSELRDEGKVVRRSPRFSKELIDSLDINI